MKVKEMLILHVSVLVICKTAYSDIDHCCLNNATNRLSASFFTKMTQNWIKSKNDDKIAMRSKRPDDFIGFKDIVSFEYRVDELL